MRIGVGFDVHRLVEGRRLFLGGIEIPYHQGLLGHSDGDVLIHAICDALLGAIAEGDIGVYFPDRDETIKDIRSTVILSHITNLIKGKGFRVVNIDTVVITEEPRIYSYREDMKSVIAEILNIDRGGVGIKGKTTEGLGFTGRGEGIAAHAVARVENL